MVFSLSDVGPAGRMHPWDGAGPELSTSPPHFGAKALRTGQLEQLCCSLHRAAAAALDDDAEAGRDEHAPAQDSAPRAAHVVGGPESGAAAEDEGHDARVGEEA